MSSPTRSTSRRLVSALGVAALPLPVLLLGGSASAAPQTHTYEVTITNRTLGQPFSPPVVVAHDPSISLFEVGQRASAPIAAIAQAGDSAPLQQALAPLLRPGGPVTGAITGSPSRPLLAEVGPPSVQTVTVEGATGDVLSLAAMLICTNDGFTGVDSVALPEQGSVTYALGAYDAGVERNTQRSEDIVDPCSAIGPVALPGDPDGNRDDGTVLEPRPKQVRPHTTVTGRGDLDPVHDWRGPVGVVQITRVG